MLEEIHISHFAIIDAQTVTFSAGFNVMSGETGAGKSILIDALGLQLGDRADSAWIRHGKSRCDIQSQYAFPPKSQIQQWLIDNEFNDEAGQCQLRRTLSDGGKSRCYINAIPTTLGNTKQLGEMLVDIHGQHAHQSLMHADKQLDLLDNFADHDDLLTAVKSAHSAWQKLIKQQQALSDSDNNLADKRDLLQYQLQELQDLALTEDEFKQLSKEQKRLSAASDILSQINHIEQMLDGDNSVSQALNQITTSAAKIAAFDTAAEGIEELFNQALIYVDEARSALNHYAQKIELDPNRLESVETRMAELHSMARKHHCSADELPDIELTLTQQLKNLDEDLRCLTEIDEKMAAAEKTFLQAAKKLRQSREKAGKRLAAAVENHLAALNLAHASFAVALSDSKAKSRGIDQVMFLFAPNPGQGQKPLHKIASGGELSRISLAIQVAAISEKTNTTLIFDEVDSGIGGATAEVVGRLLKTLSRYNQVICVTHLAQVAAFADQHLQITKAVKNNETFTQFSALSEKARIAELARMSGGINPDEKTLEHAQKLRDNALQFSKTLN